MSYHYVYRITNLKESKHYYGVRTSKIEPKFDLGIRYFSSSKDKEFKKEQKEKPYLFKYKILKIFTNRADAVNLEIFLHEKFNVGKNNSFYNRVKQTNKGFDTTGITFITIQKREELRKKWSGKENPNHYTNNKGENNPMYGVHRYGNKNPFYGKKHTNETKLLIGKKNSGKVFTKEHKQKLKDSWIDRPIIKCPHCSMESKHISNMRRYHFDNCKLKDNK